MVCVSFHFVGSKCRVIARENNRPEDTPPNPLNTTFDYSSNFESITERKSGLPVNILSREKMKKEK